MESDKRKGGGAGEREGTGVASLWRESADALGARAEVAEHALDGCAR